MGGSVASFRRLGRGAQATPQQAHVSEPPVVHELLVQASISACMCMHVSNMQSFKRMY